VQDDLARDDHLQVLLVNIVKDAEIAEPKFIAGQRIWTEKLDGLARARRLVHKPRSDPVADDPPLSYR
jgi:hypothetical protein